MNDTRLLSQEQDIVKRLEDGDQHVMAVLMELFKKNLNHIASRLIDDDGHAKDIVAVAFLKVWQRRKFESLSRIKGFLYVIVKNECTNYQARSQRIAYLHEEIAYLTRVSEDQIETKLIKSDIYRLILEEIDNLPPARKQIFKMLYLDDMSIFEIAERLHISVDTVRVQKARALTCLRHHVTKKGIMYLN